MPVKIPEPWLSFMRDVDQALGQPVTVYCLTGISELVRSLALGHPYSRLL